MKKFSLLSILAITSFGPLFGNSPVQSTTKLPLNVDTPKNQTSNGLEKKTTDDSDFDDDDSENDNDDRDDDQDDEDDKDAIADRGGDRDRKENLYEKNKRMVNPSLDR